jgi:hypothetical protein
MMATDPGPTSLFAGSMHWFADWPDGNVPRAGAIIYTIWDRAGRFLYVGMSGRGFAPGTKSKGGKGPWGRLNSHASGRRSGDQFCIYVCDRLVLPRLANRLRDIADGTLSLDNETRAYIRAELGYRWVACQSGAEALAVERAIQLGGGSVGVPLLNGKD